MEGIDLRVSPRLRVGLIAFALVYALYVLAGTVFLDTPLSRHLLNRDPERFHARWGFALTLWPGDLMVWNLDLGGHAHANLWSTQADFAHGRIALLPLFHREFRMAAIEGRQVSLERDPATFDLAAKPYTKDAWVFRFDHITTRSPRLLRMGALKLVGDGDLDFGFVKQVHGGPWQLYPSQVHMHAARLSYGSIELASQAKVDATVSIASHTHAQAPGIDLLRLADANVQIDGAAPGLSLTSDARGQRTWMNADGAGHMTAALSVSRGDLSNGSRLHWQGPLRIIDAHTHSREAGTLVADIAADAGAIQLHALIPPVPQGVGSLKADLLLAGNALPVDSWQQTATRLSGAIDLDWRFTTLRWLDQVLARAPWLRIDGAGELVAALRLEHGQLAGGSHAEIPVLALKASVLGNVIEGNGHAQGKLVDSAHGAVPNLRIDLDRFHIAPRAAPAQAFVSGRGLQMELTSGSKLSEFATAFRGTVHFADADVPDLVFYNRYLPDRSLRFLAGSGKLGNDLAFDADGHVFDDHTHLVTQSAHFTVAGAQFAADLAIDSHLRRPPNQRHQFIFDGSTVTVQNVSLDNGSLPRDTAWHGAMIVDSGVVERLHPLRMNAHVRLDMQDIRMLMALFASRHEFPKWVEHLIDDGEVHAEGDLRVQDGELILDHVTASNERFDVQARLHSANGQTDGDLYVRWKLFGIGVELHNGSHKFHLAGAREWYRSRANLLPEQRTATD